MPYDIDFLINFGMSIYLIKKFLESLNTLIPLNEQIQPFSKRSDHKSRIAEAKNARQAAAHNDVSADIAYDEAVADFESADFLPYTPDYLEQHSQIIERYTKSFNQVSNAFRAIPRSDRGYADLVETFTTAIDMYRLSIDSYWYAARQSKIDAMIADKTIQEARLLRIKLAVERYQNGEISNDLLTRKVDEIALQQESEIRFYERFLAQANAAESRAAEFEAIAESARCDAYC
jgi:hypothetical protein